MAAGVGGAALPPAHLFDEAAAGAVVRRAGARYFAARRARIAPFCARHFSWRGTLAIHRRALGWDLLRAPANLLLEVPQGALQLAAAGARRVGAKRLGAALGRPNLLIETAVAREIEWLVQTELLELPCVQKGRAARRDALGEAILADPEVAAWIHARLAALGAAGDPGFRLRLEDAMLVYAGSRAAAAEITTTLLAMGAGALSLKQLTPGAITLGPGLAAVLAQHAAIASFPLGAGLGGLWYGYFPAAPSTFLVGGLTGGLLLASAVAAPFTGIVADPVQRRLGLHARRLRRLVDSLERGFNGETEGRFAVGDHYVARLLGLVDALNGAARLALR